MNFKNILRLIALIIVLIYNYFFTDSLNFIKTDVEPSEDDIRKVALLKSARAIVRTQRSTNSNFVPPLSITVSKEGCVLYSKSPIQFLCSYDTKLNGAKMYTGNTVRFEKTENGWINTEDPIPDIKEEDYVGYATAELRSQEEMVHIYELRNEFEKLFTFLHSKVVNHELNFKVNIMREIELRDNFNKLVDSYQKQFLEIEIAKILNKEISSEIDPKDKMLKMIEEEKSKISFLHNIDDEYHNKFPKYIDLHDNREEIAKDIAYEYEKRFYSSLNDKQYNVTNNLEDGNIPQKSSSNIETVSKDNTRITDSNDSLDTKDSAGDVHPMVSSILKSKPGLKVIRTDKDETTYFSDGTTFNPGDIE